MENASKALIIAGSVLLSLLIIGALVFMLNSLSDLKQTEATSGEVEKLAEYNKQMENFNRDGLYGSEILSLANLIDDYNKKQSDLKGYQPVILNVTNITVGGIYLNKSSYTGAEGYKNLIGDFKELEEVVKGKKSIGDEVISINKEKVTVAKLAGMKDSQLVKLINEIYKGEKSDEEIQNIIDNIVKPKVDEYVNLKTEMTQFKNTKFKKSEQTVYDKNNGRITKMSFEAIN